MSKVIRLTAENFKRLRAVRIEPDQTVCKITGKNAQGKSSVLDAIWAALGGSKAIPDMPVRKGARKASVEVDLGELGAPELKVKRTFTANGGSTLTVTDASGGAVSSPQAVLDKLVGVLAFDPMAFLRMDSKKQAETLKKLAGLDFSQPDLDRQFAYEQRQKYNREAKELKARYDAIPLPQPGTPNEEVDATALSDRLSEAGREAERVTNYERELSRAVERRDTAKARLEQSQSTLDLANREVVNAHEALAVLGTTEDIKAVAENIREQLKNVTMTNKAVRDKKEWQRLGKEYTSKQDEADKMTAEMEKIDEWKAEQVRQAGMPVEGLEVTEDAVTFKGVPLKQCSSSEQIRITLGMGEALNPTLRTMYIRDGSLLDPDSFRQVALWAGENDMQLIIESVASTDSPTGIVLEDGEVVAITPLFDLDDQKSD